MKITLANDSAQKIGGGWTFLRTFEKYAQRAGAEFGPGGQVYFISGATMVERASVEEAKKQSMKIVLRVDNIPRNSRNRNTGTSRLYDFAQLADLVVYQSQWAKEYIMPFLKKDGPVIVNGADEEVFCLGGQEQHKEGRPQCLFVQYNRDETKQWHQAWYKYQMLVRDNPKAHLWILGNFSPEHQQYGFDFFMGEKFRYIGVLTDPADMAEYYRGTDVLFLPYYNDACSQTLIEARLCGVKTIIENGTGGNKDIMAAKLDELKASYMAKRYLEEIKKIL